MKNWRRLQTLLGYTALAVLLVLQFGPYRETPLKPFLWFFAPVMLLLSVVHFFVNRQIRRNQPLLKHARTPSTLESALMLIAEAQTSLKIHSDTLNPTLQDPLEAAQARGLKVEVFLDEPGVRAFENKGATLKPALWVPEPQHRMRQLIVDTTYVLQGAFIGTNDTPFGPEAKKVETMTEYLLREVMP